MEYCDKTKPLSEPQLRALLRDPHGPVRGIAIEELMELKPSDGRSLAIAALSDSEMSVRDAGLDYFEDNFELAMTPALIAAAERGFDWDFGMRQYVLHPDNDRYFSQWIASPSKHLRDTVISALSYDGDEPRFLDRLLAHAQRENDPDVLDTIVMVLGGFEDERARRAIVAIGRRSEGDVLERVIGSIGQHASADGRSFLNELLRSQNGEVRRSAKRALKTMDAKKPGGE
jgi:HEAT repeat protein